MRVLITGVAGFIGSHVADAMLRRHWEVFGLDDLSGGFRANVPEGCVFFERDCNANLDDIFGQVNPDAVLHLAAYAAEGLSHHIPTFNYTNNIVGTANVLSTAYRYGVKHFGFTSSIAVYGHPRSDAPLRENQPCVPCDPYGIAKLACEQHVQAFFEYYGGPKYTIFRPHNVIGPRQNISDPYRNVAGIFFRCVKTGEPFPVFGDGSQTRSFSYIDTIADCIAESPTTAAATNQVINVGGDQPMSVAELAKAIARISRVDCQIRHLPARQEVLHAHADHQRARDIFPEIYENSLTVEEGLRQMWEFVREQEIPPPTGAPVDIEIRDRLPPSWNDDGP